MKKIIGLFLLVMGVSTAAHAGLLIEPYLGYDMGTSTLKDLSGVDDSGKSTTTVIGGRLGYRLPMRLWFAADAAMGTGGTFKPDNSAAASSDFTSQSLGVDVGFDLPFLFRFWAGYGFNSSVTIKGTGGGNDTKMSGTSMKAGIGFNIIPKLSLNFEYMINSFTKVDSGTEVDIGDVFKTHDDTGMMLSLSAPFDL